MHLFFLHFFIVFVLLLSLKELSSDSIWSLYHQESPLENGCAFQCRKCLHFLFTIRNDSAFLRYLVQRIFLFKYVGGNADNFLRMKLFCFFIRPLKRMVTERIMEIQCSSFVHSNRVEDQNFEHGSRFLFLAFQMLD